MVFVTTPQTGGFGLFNQNAGRSRSRSRSKKQYGGNPTTESMNKILGALNTLKGGRRRRRTGKSRRTRRRRSTKKHRGGAIGMIA